MHNTPIPKFIGAKVRRREDPALITGRGQYVADVKAEDALVMVVVRSPHAHARILGIDSSQAESMPGVLAVLTASDINPRLEAPLPVLVGTSVGEYSEVRNPDRYALAVDRVRCVGDPVAVMVCEDPYTAADALETVFVDYEVLPAVTDLKAALEPDSPLLYESHKDNRAFAWKVKGGDVKGAFAEAQTVVEVEARIQRLIPSAMEPRAVTAAYADGTDQLTVWTSTQIPHLVRDQLAAILGMPETQVRVIAPEVGGGFGAKANVYPEEVLVPFLARKLNRSVRWVASRGEDFLSTTHGRDQMSTLRLAADGEGRVKGAELRVVADCGAYHSRCTPVVAPLTGHMMTGVYDIPNVGAEVVGVFTNKVSMEPYRGAGRPEAAYLIERAMDRLAKELNMDPAEVRRRNFIPPQSFPYKTAVGLNYDSGDYAATMETALREADYENWREEQVRRRQAGEKPVGIGISCYVEICGFGPWEAGTVTMNQEGQVVVLTGSSPQGQGHETSWAQVASDMLQVPMEDIEVRHSDTAVVPEGIGTFGSRSAALGGSSVLRSSEVVRDAAQEIAAHMLEAAPADMTLSEGRFHVVGVPERSLSWKEIAEAAHGERLPTELRGRLTAATRFEPEGETYPFGVHVCMVEIDPETGEIKILRYLTFDDCGKVINPLLVEGQVHGGLAQGIGQALLESAVYDSNGNLTSGSFMDYALPRAHLLPSFEANRTETPTPLNPLGVKGVGEAGTIGSTPAVVNSVVDALSHMGVEHLDTPLTPEKIWHVLRAHETRS